MKLTFIGKKFFRRNKIKSKNFKLSLIIIKTRRLLLKMKNKINSCQIHVTLINMHQRNNKDNILMFKMIFN